MEDISLILDLVLALGFAFVGGLIADRFGLPVLVGYILAGVIIGPNTPGLTADFERVQLLANLGVAFLMFAIGVEFALDDLRRVQRTALISGAIQISLTVVVGYVIGSAIGWRQEAAILLGCAFAISSSIVTIKLFSARGEIESTQARLAIGLGLVQDLSVVPILAVLPALSGNNSNGFAEVGRALLIAAIALALVILVGSRLVPRLLFYVAKTGSRELFLLAVVTIALGTAYASNQAGLSLAIGAFLAGIIVSESEFNSQVLSEVIPLRDVFSTLFFVALGMLVQPRQVADSFWMIVAVVAILVVGKAVITGGAFLLARVDHRTATLAALSVAQIGEFSFVIASEGRVEGILDRDQYSLIVDFALGSILLAPLLFAIGPRVVDITARLPGVRAQERAIVGEPLPRPLVEPAHVVICGYGRIGTVLGRSLEQVAIPYSVIELNAGKVRELRKQGIDAHYGDAASYDVLKAAGVADAHSIAITATDLVATQAAVRNARLLNPEICVIARASTRRELELLRASGADEVVQPEFEAGLQFIRHVFDWHEVDETVTADVVDRGRTIFYEIEQQTRFE
jgi:CPA2 family monovalent cation:H+ antiporter-2